jgi:hypothetical protein
MFEQEVNEPIEVQVHAVREFFIVWYCVDNGHITIGQSF